MPHYDYDDDDSPFDERGILKDGRTVHVSFMDSQQARGWSPPDTRAGGPFVVDHRPGGPGCEPDRRPAFDAATLHDARTRLQREYQLYDAEAATQYKHPPNGPRRDAETEFTGSDPYSTGTGAPARGYDRPAGTYPYATHLVGTACTINGAPGSLQPVDGYLACVPDDDASEESEDAAPRSLADALETRRRAMADAVDAYDAEQANRWRNPR
jgi:hypothetical protein